MAEKTTRVCAADNSVTKLVLLANGMENHCVRMENTENVQLNLALSKSLQKQRK